MNNQTLGRLGEDAAVNYLEQQGYRILCRNFRCRDGEIDIIALTNETLTFVEVKTRRSDAFGYPADSITAQKKERLWTTARHFLLQPRSSDLQPKELRFDAVEITINHMQDII